MKDHHSKLMDKIYRHQRYIYDLSRKYFLLGRDQLLASLKFPADSSVLEVGCGTGRNLRVLAQQSEIKHLYGLDASDEMLQTARLRNQRLVEGRRLTLAWGLAETFSFTKTFHRSEPFDAIIFSYSLSMIPNWESAVENALMNIREDGLLAVVDFYHQKQLPSWFRKALNKFLALYHVYPDPAIPDLLIGKGAQLHSLHKDYAFCAFLQRQTLIQS